MSGLPLLGIYQKQLEDAIETVKDACDRHGIDEDELWTFIWQDMDESNARARFWRPPLYH